MTHPTVVSAREVCKSFGDFQALRGINLDIKPGECFGLLGPNGAGKSTFIRMLYGISPRNGGDLTVFGHDPQVAPREVKGQVGVVTQDNDLDLSMNVYENMWHYAGFVGIPKTEREGRIMQLLTEMNLEHKTKATIRSLSGGMQRRLVFVRALLATPPFLILDEPTTGLDPAVRVSLWDKIRELKSKKVTILLTTHYMDEAERLCDRLAIMDAGRVCTEGKPQDLISQWSPGFVLAIAKGNFPAGLTKLQEAAPNLTWHEDTMTYQSLCPSLDAAYQLTERLKVQPEVIRPSNLEDVFLAITGRELGKDA